MRLFENVSHVKCFRKSHISQMLKSCLVEFWLVFTMGARSLLSSYSMTVYSLAFSN